MCVCVRVCVHLFIYLIFSFFKQVWRYFFLFIFYLFTNLSNPVRPVVGIFSSPKNNRLRIGASMNLTCTAQPRKEDSVYLDRWVDYIEWHDPQGRRVGAICRQPSNVHAHKPKLSCPLSLKKLTVDRPGTYTCQAGNGYKNHCTKRSVWITGMEPYHSFI